MDALNVCTDDSLVFPQLQLPHLQPALDILGSAVESSGVTWTSIRKRLPGSLGGYSKESGQGMTHVREVWTGRYWRSTKERQTVRVVPTVVHDLFGAPQQR